MDALASIFMHIFERNHVPSRRSNANGFFLSHLIHKSIKHFFFVVLFKCMYRTHSIQIDCLDNIDFIFQSTLPVGRNLNADSCLFYSFECALELIFGGLP